MTKLATFGVVLTSIYVVGVGFLAFDNWQQFGSLGPNEWGDFLAGTLGPLAIFWLILGFFQQGSELRHSVKALELQAEELRRSVEQQQAMVSITEKQLQLDIELRDKEGEVTAERELPFFQLSKKPDSGRPTLGSTQYGSFKLTNSGAHANSVQLSISPPGFSARPSSFGSFPNQDSQAIDLPFEIGFFNLPRLIIESKNLKGQHRRQEFSLEQDGARMISCFPDTI